MGERNNHIIEDSELIRKIVEWLKNKSFPGFGGAPIYDVTKHFKKAVFNGALGTRSASLAFNFILALFPGLLFLV